MALILALSLLLISAAYVALLVLLTVRRSDNFRPKPNLYVENSLIGSDQEIARLENLVAQNPQNSDQRVELAWNYFCSKPLHNRIAPGLQNYMWFLENNVDVLLENPVWKFVILTNQEAYQKVKSVMLQHVDSNPKNAVLCNKVAQHLESIDDTLAFAMFTSSIILEPNSPKLAEDFTSFLSRLESASTRHLMDLLERRLENMTWKHEDLLALRSLQDSFRIVPEFLVPIVLRLVGCMNRMRKAI